MNALRRRRQGKARVLGRAGGSARIEYRRHAAAYRKVPGRWLALTWVLLAALVGTGANSLGHSPWPPAIAAAAGLLAFHLVLRFSAVAATVVVCVLFTATAAPRVATAYASATQGAGARGGVAVLIAATALVAVLAHLTSRGRPWLTTLLAIGAMSVLGPFLLLVLPQMGFLAAYLVAASVLVVRAGMLSWVADRADAVRESFMGTLARIRTRGVPDEIARWKRGAEGEERTAALLEDLDHRFTVMHDLALPGTPANVDHLVIGPTGMFLVDSKLYQGVVREHPQRGLEHNSRRLADTFATVLFERARVAAELGVAETTITVLVVIHEAVLPGQRTRVGLFDDQGAPVGEVTVLAPTALVPGVTAGGDVLTRRATARLVRRARLRLLPATARGLKPSPINFKRTGSAATARSLDERGKPQETGNAPTPMFTSTSVGDVQVHLGESVTLLTTQGAYPAGVRVCSQPYAQADGIITVNLCTEEDWNASQAAGRPPVDVTPYPLASVQPNRAANMP